MVNMTIMAIKYELSRSMVELEKGSGILGKRQGAAVNETCFDK